MLRQFMLREKSMCLERNISNSFMLDACR